MYIESNGTTYQNVSFLGQVHIQLLLLQKNRCVLICLAKNSSALTVRRFNVIHSVFHRHSLFAFDM